VIHRFCCELEARAQAAIGTAATTAAAVSFPCPPLIWKVRKNKTGAAQAANNTSPITGDWRKDATGRSLKYAM
jgi:hypothetical protein